jgi:hypothetical protein
MLSEKGYAIPKKESLTRWNSVTHYKLMKFKHGTLNAIM